MISVVVGGEVGLLRSIEEGCSVVIDEMPIHVSGTDACDCSICRVLHSCYLKDTLCSGAFMHFFHRKLP